MVASGSKRLPAVSLALSCLIALAGGLIALGAYLGWWFRSLPGEKQFLNGRELWFAADRPDTKPADPRLADACKEFASATEINHLYGPAYFYWARVCQRQDNTKDAIANYAKAIDAHEQTTKMDRDEREKRHAVPLDDPIQAYSELATLLNETGNPRGAVENFNRALDLNRDSAAAYCGKGKACLLLHDPAQALVALDAAIGLAPTWCEAICLHARANHEAGNYEGAKADARRAIHLDEKCADAHLTLGLALLASPDQHDGPLGHLAEAFRLYKARTPQQGPELAEAYYRLSVALTKLKQDPPAKEAYALAVKLDPLHSFPAPDADVVAMKPKLEAARLLLEQDRLDEALAMYTVVLQLDSRNVATLLERGSAFLQKGDWDSALADFDRAIELERNSADAYCRRAYAYLKTGDWYRARLDATDAIRLKPDLALAHLYRAAACLMEKRFDRARADAEEAVALDQKLPQRNLLLYHSAEDIYVASFRREAGDLIASHRWEDAVNSLNAIDPEKWSGKLFFPTELHDWLPLQRAGVYARMGSASLAAQDWAAAIVHFNKAIVDFNAAIRIHSDNAARNGPQLALVFAERGYAHARCSEFAESAADFKEAFRLDAQQGRIWALAGETSCLLARYYRDLERKDFERTKWRDAIREFRQAIRFDRELKRELQGPLEDAQRSLDVAG